MLSRDCTGRGAIVLDTFCGSGTTILAAEPLACEFVKAQSAVNVNGILSRKGLPTSDRVGRRAYTLEIEPRFVDLASASLSAHQSSQYPGWLPRSDRARSAYRDDLRLQTRADLIRTVCTLGGPFSWLPLGYKALGG